MLEALLGNKTAESTLLYLANYDEGYASAIAHTYDISLNMVQKQLARLEMGQIVVSHWVGKTRVYQLNPRWFFFKDLYQLLTKALEAVSEEDIRKYYRQRRRPRRKDKPLWQK
ncbi:MAG TPA: winged helix-turn-helix domain-containing protein [Bdellovibrionota bacterium]|nr:winged helix-turn-helix domain-containing protein [Bdellovibrionota bacterium]